MALNDEQHEEMKLLLEQLESERGRMKPRTQEFFDEQLKRFNQYGQRMFPWSVKQRDWIISTYEELVGPFEHLGGKAQSGNATAKPETEQDDMKGDDIPF